MTTARAFFRTTKGKNSPYNIFLEDNGQIVSSEGVTRCDLNFIQNGVAGPVISSSVDPTWFTLEYAATHDGVQTKAVRVDLMDATLNPGRYEVEVFVWDAVSTSGRFAGTLNAQISGPLSTPIGAAAMDLYGNLRIPFVTPSTITGNQDDYSPGSSNAHVRLASDAERTVTGIAYVADGQVRKFTNVGSNNIIFAHQSVDSVAANRMISQRGHDVTLRAGDTIEALYDGETNRWRLFRSPAPYYPVTAAEALASVVPKNTEKSAGQLLRYGAVIDGVTDDANAWDNAVDQFAQGGPAVSWEGNSAFDRVIQLPANCKIEGRGRSASRATFTGFAGQAFKKRTSETNIAHLCLRDFSLFDTGSGAIGLDFSQVADSHVENIYISGFTSSVLLSSSVTGYCARNRFIGVGADNGANGFATAGVVSVAGHLFLACYAAAHSGSGFYLTNQLDCSIIGGGASACSVAGVNIATGADRTIVNGVRFASNTKDWTVSADDCVIGPNKYQAAATYTDSGTGTVVIESDGLLRTTKSVANVNTPSGVTARAMPMYDNDGVLLGYSPLYAAEW